MTEWKGKRGDILKFVGPVERIYVKYGLIVRIDTGEFLPKQHSIHNSNPGYVAILSKRAALEYVTRENVFEETGALQSVFLSLERIEDEAWNMKENAGCGFLAAMVQTNEIALIARALRVLLPDMALVLCDLDTRKNRLAWNLPFCTSLCVWKQPGSAEPMNPLAIWCWGHTDMPTQRHMRAFEIQVLKPMEETIRILMCETRQSIVLFYGQSHLYDICIAPSLYASSSSISSSSLSSSSLSSSSLSSSFVLPIERQEFLLQRLQRAFSLFKWIELPNTIPQPPSLAIVRMELQRAQANFHKPLHIIRTSFAVKHSILHENIALIPRVEIPGPPPELQHTLRPLLSTRNSSIDDDHKEEDALLRCMTTGDIASRFSVGTIVACVHPRSRIVSMFLKVQSINTKTQIIEFSSPVPGPFPVECVLLPISFP